MNIYKGKKTLTIGLIYLEFIVVAIIVIYPLLWVVGSALNPVNSISRAQVIPENPTLDNFVKLFQKTKFPAWYKNTLYVSILTTIFTVLIHTATAFVFARFKFKGRKMGLLAVMILQMFPSFLGLTALYMVALNFGMLNNLYMLVIIYVSGGIPGNIWLVRGYMLNIPKSLDEAAFIDGASKIQLFYKVILPLSLPIVLFIAVGAFMGPWMDYMLPRYLINQNEKRTLAIGLFDMISGNTNEFTTFCAGCVLVAIPITILYMVFQKFLLEGLVAGANKGE
ncbi:MAG: sugar ABC transporter permease [Spirochaetaceae bacterium]|jgi:arabinogalactan oligomer/maltooligosaccharide transport system permease protein|nr:sugar ABC transporter permease [Spirochaetaceae bacterium]